MRLTFDSLTLDGEEYVFVVEGDTRGLEPGMVLAVDPANLEHRGFYRVTAVGEGTITAVPYRTE